MLIEDCRTAHAECINNTKTLVILKAGDIVMARTAIQSDLSKNKVAKLSYSVRGSYQILRYFVRKLNKYDSPNLKFMAHILYPLPPSLIPCEPIDSTDTRYLNQTYAPLVNPLKKALHVEMYNEKWFNKPIPTTDSPITYTYDTLKFPDKSPLPFPSVLELHKETNTCSPKLLLAIEDYSLPPLPSPLALHNSHTNSDRLFFIQYLPERIL